jgi:hypothetical protein
MMRHTRPFKLLLLACCLTAAAAVSTEARQAAPLTGVVTMENGLAPPRLSVRLSYPKGMKKMPIVTYTDRSGRFTISLQAGRYMLELYQGNTLCYQTIVTVTGRQPQTLNIRLKPSAAAG